MKTKKELALDVFTVLNDLTRSQAENLAVRGHGEYVKLIKKSKPELVALHAAVMSAAQRQGRCTCWAAH